MAHISCVLTKNMTCLKPRNKRMSALQKSPETDSPQLDPEKCLFKWKTLPATVYWFYWVCFPKSTFV